MGSQDGDNVAKIQLPECRDVPYCKGNVALCKGVADLKPLRRCALTCVKMFGPLTSRTDECGRATRPVTPPCRRECREGVPTCRISQQLLDLQAVSPFTC